MIIKKIELFHLRLPMTIIFKTSFGVIDYRPAIIIKMEDEKNNVGCGESSLLDVPISENETTQIGIKILEEKIFQKILNKKIDTTSQLRRLLKKYFNKYPVTLTGVESAFLNLLSIRKKKSLQQMFGGKRKKIPIGMSIGIQKNAKVLIFLIKKNLREGYEKIKIKIEPGYDLKIIEAVRKKFQRLNLSVDANAAYSKKHLSIFKKMDKYKLTMIEQPFKKEDLRLHAELQKQISTPICLDESVYDFDSAKKVIKMKSCKIINIKPARVGGFSEAIKIHNLCQKKHIPCWVGGRLETGLGSAFNLALASLPNFTLAAEILPVESFLKDDILGRKIKFVDGFMHIPKFKNNRIKLHQTKLKKYAVYYQKFSN